MTEPDDDQNHAITHESFYATVLTEAGKVKAINEGDDGAKQVQFDSGIRAVLKPQMFSNKVRHGIDASKQYLREAAAYQFDRQLLGWNLVPPTTLTVYKSRPASIQAWMSGVPARALAPKLFNAQGQPDRKAQAALLAAKVNTAALRRLVILDLLINNTDRHGKNAVFDTMAQRVWAIDNGKAFGCFMEGYYNVFHMLLWPKHLRLSQEERMLLEAISPERLQKALKRYLTPAEIRMAALRVEWVLMQDNLGYTALTQGKDIVPSWRTWFLKHLSEVVPSEFSARVARMGANSLTVTRQGS